MEIQVELLFILKKDENLKQRLKDKIKLLKKEIENYKRRLKKKNHKNILEIREIIKRL